MKTNPVNVKNEHKPGVTLLQVFALLTCMSTTALAQRSPKQIIDTYIRETGGRQKYAEIENWKFKIKRLIIATVPKEKRKTREDDEASMQQIDITLTVDTSGRFAAKCVHSTNLVVDMGSNGIISWFNEKHQGYQFEEANPDAETGTDLTYLDLNMLLRPEKEFKSMKSLGVVKIKDRICNGIEVVRRNGRVEKHYFSVESGLRFKMEFTMQTRRIGKRKVERYYFNYENSKSGILLPRIMHEHYNGEAAGGVRIIEFETNCDIDKDAFELPDELKTLIRQSQKAKS